MSKLWPLNELTKNLLFQVNQVLSSLVLVLRVQVRKLTVVHIKNYMAVRLNKRIKNDLTKC